MNSQQLKLIDSHAHLTSEKVFSHLPEILKRAEQQHISTIVNICTDVDSWEKGRQLALSKTWIYNAAATTPHDVEKEGELFFPIVEKAAQAKELIAIGETGLDYFYAHSPPDLQRKYFVDYCHLARRSKLPLIIHCRDAFADLFDITKTEYADSPLLLHCFTAGIDEAKEALERGWKISFSGIVTFTKSESLREVVRYVPIESILVETDTPYLAPQKQRGKPNEPSFLVETLETVAKIKGISLEKAGHETTRNACEFFSF